MLSDRLLYSAELRTRSLLRTVLWSVLALLCALGGLGFLGSALWLWIASVGSPAAASLVLGMVFLVVAGAAALVAMFGRSRPLPPHRGVGIDDLAQAFFTASQLGRAARRK
jgi:hypothetical protein